MRTSSLAMNMNSSWVSHVGTRRMRELFCGFLTLELVNKNHLCLGSISIFLTSTE